jgi:4-amino-4-deoxy-L-arabinose transferase-like glycosyltransferase
MPNLFDSRSLFAGIALKDVSSDVQFLILCLGIGLAVYGLAGHPPPPPMTDKSKYATGQRFARLLVPVLILFLAFAARIWNLYDSNRFFIDELLHVAGIRAVSTDASTGILIPFSGIAAFPYIFPFLQHHAITIFGHNFLGLRVVSAVIGTLTVAALYVLGRSLFGRKTALIAAALLATFPPHLQFSRIGLNNIADPLFGTLALAFLGRGLMSNRRMDYVVGGAMLGLTHYFYEGGRLGMRLR